MKKSIITITSLMLILCLLTACTSTKDKQDENTITENKEDNIIFEDNNSVDDTTQEETPVSYFEYSTVNDCEIHITRYLGDSESVIIPSNINGLPVTKIEKDAFKETNIKEVSFPNSIKHIGDNAFKGCLELTELNLSSTKLKSIGNNAFYDCRALKKVELPDSLLCIYYRAFFNCTSIEELYLPKNLLEIESEAFGRCTSLKKVTIPPLLYMDLKTPFYQIPSLETIIFEEGREEIAGYCYFMPIESDITITVPKGVKKFYLSTFKVKEFAEDIKVNVIFLGDCPETFDTSLTKYGITTIYYYPDTNGWENCNLDEKYTFIPINE